MKLTPCFASLAMAWASRMDHTMPRLSESQSALSLRALPRLHRCEREGSERVGKAEDGASTRSTPSTRQEYMYLQAA